MAKTREDVGKMTPDEVFDYVQNQDTQRDDAVADAARVESEKASLVTARTAALAAKDIEKEQAVVDAVAPLRARIAELEQPPFDPVAVERERQRAKNIHRNKLKPKE